MLSSYRLLSDPSEHEADATSFLSYFLQYHIHVCAYAATAHLNVRLMSLWWRHNRGWTNFYTWLHSSWIKSELESFSALAIAHFGCSHPPNPITFDLVEIARHQRALPYWDGGSLRKLTTFGTSYSGREAEDYVPLVAVSEDIFYLRHADKRI